MKKQGYNWSEKDCTMYLKENDCGQSKKFQGNNTRHWVSTLPKQTEHKNKNVKFNKKKTPWEDN
jgi:hypothetical protein